MRSSKRFTAYSFYPNELKFGMKILDIILHNRYEQGVLGAGKGAQNFRIFGDICTCFIISPSQKSLLRRSKR